MNRHHNKLAQIFLCAVTFTISTTTQAGYMFKNIADSTGPLNSFNNNDAIDSASINNNGTIAFWASLDAGGSAIYTSNGFSLTTVASTATGPYTAFSPPSINNSGTVAFGASLPSSQYGVFAVNGATTTTIADTSGPLSTLKNTITTWTTTRINDSGTVAFWARRDAGGDGIFAGSGGPLTTIASSSSSFPHYLLHPNINSAGTVAFAADVGGGVNAAYIGDGTTTTTVLDTTGEYNLVGDVNINNNGLVLLAAQTDGGDFRMLKGTVGSLTTVADSNGSPFARFTEGPGNAINSANNVAFWALDDGTTTGIWTGPNFTTDKVIARGDPLFGSTLNNLYLSSSALNDSGQVVFRYQLANGVEGIALATLPEPHTATLALLTLALARRRRR